MQFFAKAGKGGLFGEGKTILNGFRFALAIFSGRIIFISRLSRSAERSKRYFHGRDRKGKQHLQRRFLRKRGAAGGRLLPLGGAGQIIISSATVKKEKTT